MAGFKNSKARAEAAEAEIVELKAKLAQYQAENRPKRARIVSRQYDESIIDELIQWSDEGQFLDECFAQWGIERETFDAWCAEHVELRAAVGPSRARARAAMLKTLRTAMQTRASFPTALADRVLAHIEKENGQAEAKADSFVRIELCPRCATADPLSVEKDS